MAVSTTANRVLLIDDEPAITESLAYAFARAGFETQSAASLAQADEVLAARSGTAEDFDLVVLDLMLPDGHGLEWLRALRTRSTLPVIILSSHDDPVDHIVGLEVGADDYIDKPFSPREVIARVRAVLRRAARPHTSSAGGAADALPAPLLLLDHEKRTAFANGTALNLSRTEFDLLSVLTSSPGRVFEREHLLDRVWGDVSVTERSVDAYVKALRKKLSEAGLSAEVIETVRGVGYRLAETPPR